MGSFLWDTLVFSLPLFSECSILSFFFFFFFAFLHCTPIDFPHHFHFSTPTNFFSPVMGGEGGLLTLFLFPSFLPLTRASLFTLHSHAARAVCMDWLCMCVNSILLHLSNTNCFLYFFFPIYWICPPPNPTSQPANQITKNPTRGEEGEKEERRREEKRRGLGGGRRGGEEGACCVIIIIIPT